MGEHWLPSLCLWLPCLGKARFEGRLWFQRPVACFGMDQGKHLSFRRSGRRDSILVLANIWCIGDSENIQITGHSAGKCLPFEIPCPEAIYRIRSPFGTPAPAPCIAASGWSIRSVHLGCPPVQRHSVSWFYLHLLSLSLKPLDSADPKTPAELEPQFESLCKALKLDPGAVGILETLRDPIKVPPSDITNAIEHLESYGTFRGCLSDDWIITSHGQMERQRDGSFSRTLQARGVRYVVVGDLKRFVHPCLVSENGLVSFPSRGGWGGVGFSPFRSDAAEKVGTKADKEAKSV